MRNFKLMMEYDGGRYEGWQRLGKDESTNTIENKVTEVLSKMTGEKIELFCGMRTEKGIHAYGQVANFKSETDMSCVDILHYLNRYLPRDIAVIKVVEVPERFHASLNARSKTFIYRIDVNEIPDVFQRRYMYNSFKKLNVSKMSEACSYLEGKHDFKKFSSAKKNKNTLKEVFSAKVIDDGSEVQLEICANDFLHNMGKLIFGTLLQIGRGELEPGIIKDLLDVDSDVVPTEVADSCGMFLREIEY
ncbi:MAG: tRNA pseudouridine(38-40) synthase TruA [Lachnospiraceae bacterium]